MDNLVATIFEIAPDHVKDDRRHGMANMSLIVGRHTANVHTHHTGFDGGKWFKFAAERVKDLECHSLVLRFF